MKRQQQAGYIWKVGRSWFGRWRDDVIENGQVCRRQCSAKLADVCDRFRTKADVRPLLVEKLRALNEGRSRPESTLPVADFVEKFYFKFIEENYKPSTIGGYKSLWRTYLSSRLKKIILRDFRTVDAAQLLNDIHRTTGLGRTTLKHIKSFLSGVFSYAKNQGVFDGMNPIHEATIPKKAAPSEETHATTLAEVLAFMDILDKSVVACFALALGLLCTFILVVVIARPSPGDYGITSSFGKRYLFSKFYPSHACQIPNTMGFAKNIFISHDSADVQPKVIPVENCGNLSFGDGFIHFFTSRKRNVRIYWPYAPEICSLFWIEREWPALRRWIGKNLDITIRPNMIGGSLAVIIDRNSNLRRIVGSKVSDDARFCPNVCPQLLLSHISTNSVGLPNRTPLKNRYKSIDGSCRKRSPGRISYTLLNAVLFITFGLRASYRLIVKGDDSAYFIPYKVLTPLCFLFLIAGWGFLLESFFYVTNPCSKGDDDMPDSSQDFHLNLDNVPRKYPLTSVIYRGTVIVIGRTNMANVLPIEKQVAVISALAEGSGIRQTERMTGVNRETIMKLGVRVGKGCAGLLDRKMRDLPCRQLQFDELWGFIGKKEKHVTPKDNPELGDVWTFCAIDPETKIVPSFKVGKRDSATANAFVADVKSRMANRVQISSDALKAYVEAIEESFGADVDFAQIIKTYTFDVSEERNYSAPEIVVTDKRRVSGFPDMSKASTSHIERLNGTTRLHMRRLTRLTYAFSKKLENFDAAVALHFAYYNFVKRHNTLRMTPAMAAGIERDFWTVSDLVEAVA